MSSVSAMSLVASVVHHSTSACCPLSRSWTLSTTYLHSMTNKDETTFSVATTFVRRDSSWRLDPPVTLSTTSGHWKMMQLKSMACSAETDRHVSYLSYSATCSTETIGFRPVLGKLSVAEDRGAEHWYIVMRMKQELRHRSHRTSSQTKHEKV